MRKTAVIGGTGLEKLPEKFELAALTLDTRYGTAFPVHAKSEGSEFIFLSRHGGRHNIAPHEINYRANILALSELGIERIIATNAVGSLRIDLPPGTITLLDDFIDFTRLRPVTLNDREPSDGKPVAHSDFSQPYCPEVRDAILATANELSITVLPKCNYVGAEGPRFESPAEIRMFAKLGGDVVGMTGLPEAVFAREAGICYAGIAIVTNYGAGLTSKPVEHSMVASLMEENATVLQTLILRAMRMIPVKRGCNCSKPCG